MPPQRLRIQRALDGRRTEVERVQQMGVQIYTVTEFVAAEGTGVNIVQVDFPVMFIEEPGYSDGFVLGANQPVDLDNVPKFDAIVAEWVNKRAVPDGLYYVGARIAVELTGRADQKGTLHFHFLGRALTNPVDSSDDQTAL